jgi:hypothetical protein
MSKQPTKTNGDANHKPPAIVASAAPPAHLAEYTDQAGAGTSQAAEDNLVPLIYVLQSNSPQVDRRSPAYVEGAEPGDIWLRNAPKGLEIVKGEEGALVQPCYFYRDVGEWIPRDDGGGFVGRHNVVKAADIQGAKQDPDDKNHWLTADGTHDLVETRNHAVLVYAGGRALPYLIPLSSTGHSVSRGWMMKMNDKTITDGPNRGRPYPSYAHLYRLTTEQRKNNEGTWFALVVEDEVWASAEQAAAGRKLHDQFKSGEKVAEAPVEAAQAPGNDAAGEMGGDHIPF